MHSGQSFYSGVKSQLLYFPVFIILMLIGLLGCSEEPMSPFKTSPDMELVQSSDGPIRILNVDPRKSLLEEPRQLSSLNRVLNDSSLFYREQFCETGHDEELKLSSGLTGESKVKLEKNTLPENMTVIFEWGGGDVYEGKITSREFGTAVSLNQAASIQISYKEGDVTEVDESTVGLYIYNELNADWELLTGQVEPDKKKVVASLGRFGKLKLFHIKNGNRCEIETISNTEYQAKQFIEAKRGAKLKVEGPDLDKSFVEFKDHDLPADMTVSFKWADGSFFSGKLTCLETAYKDVIFNHPVKIQVSYKNAQLAEITEAGLDLFQFNATTETWEPLQ
ncbi:MAG: hypothetical protein WAN36_16975, partial [Calditrichia bacterium]